MASKHLHGIHIDLIEVWSFFTIDFDRNKMCVQNPRKGLTFETLVFHHVTPMAGRVTNGKKNRFVLLPRLGDGFLAPGIPIDWIVFVL